MEINSKDGTCKDKEGERFYPTIYWKPLEEYKDSFSSSYLDYKERLTR